MLCLALSDLLEGVMLTCGCLSQLFICMHMRDIILLLEQGILMAEEGYQTSLFFYYYYSSFFFFFLLFRYFFKDLFCSHNCEFSLAVLSFSLLKPPHIPLPKEN